MFHDEKGEKKIHIQCEKLEGKRCLPRHEASMADKRARRHTLAEGVSHDCKCTMRNEFFEIGLDEFTGFRVAREFAAYRVFTHRYTCKIIFADSVSAG